MTTFIDPQSIADPPPIDDVPEHRRCNWCGAPMPADVGEWIVAPAVAGAFTIGVLVLCSRECDEQLHAEEVPHVF